MANFITISLLAYAVAFLFFTPVRMAGKTEDERCIKKILFAAYKPTTGKDPLSFIRDRMKCIVSETPNSSRTVCIIEEVLVDPANVHPQRYTSLRFVHEFVFKRLKSLFECLTEAINIINNDNVRQKLREAQGLVFSGIKWHHKQERLIESKGRSAQKKLAFPQHDSATIERYVDEEAYLKSLRRLKVALETSGALPATTAVPPYGNAPMFDSTNPGIQLSDGYNDPQYYPYDTEFALPAHEQ
ncbi:hypothetical protein SeLEV6574_g08442, partial [Synchytrium endobioticum]